MTTTMPSLLESFRRIDPRKELIDERWGLTDHFAVQAGLLTNRQLMNMNRITAHAPLMAYKIAEAQHLGLLDSGGLSFLANAFLTGGLDQQEFLETIARRARLTVDATTDRLLGLCRMGTIEFHPTDRCNCRCTGCIYGQSSQVHQPLRRSVFPFCSLEMLGWLKPKTIILVGGGEPTIYSHDRHDFGDMTSLIRQKIPGVCFGLVTNGVFFPENCDWNDFSFVRISLGGTDAENYRERKGIDAFQTVLDNALRYLSGPIPHLVFNYMINRNTIDSCLDFSQFIYDHIRKHAPQHLPKCSIQYRPLIFSPNLSRASGQTLETEGLDVTPQQIEQLIARIEALSLPEAQSAFILNQTNLEDCLQGTRSHNPTPFHYCCHALLFGQIRADGTVQPCNVRSDDPVVRLGDVNGMEGLLKLAVKQFKVFLKIVPDDLCDPVNCRRHGKNRYMEMEQPFVNLAQKTMSLELLADGGADLLKKYDALPSGINYFF